MKENSTIFITGGAGFLGTEISKNLSSERIMHTIFDRSLPKYSSNYFKYIQGDLRNLSLLNSALKNHQTIIHLAAEWNDIGVSEYEYRTTNIDGTKNIVISAENNKVEKIIFCSSSSVYEFLPDRIEPYCEKDAGKNPKTLYGQTKVAGEEILQEWFYKSKERKLKIIRPSVIYGPYNKGNVYNLIKQLISPFFIFPAKYNVVKSIAYVENVASFFLFVLKNNPSEIIYNYCDNPALTTFELVNKIRSLLKKKGALITINPKILLFISSLLDYAGEGIKNKFGSMKVKKFLLPTHLSNELAFKTGFTQPVSTVEGLKKTIEWIVQSQKME